MRVRTPLIGASLCLLAAPAWTPPVRAQGGDNPAALLKRSMDKYAAMPTFQADCAWSVQYPSTPGTTQKRVIRYARPNRFKIVSSGAQTHFEQTSVSDGKKLVEYSSFPGMGAMNYPAPASLSVAASMQMQHPMFCGTLLYKFFGGAAQYAALVDERKMPLKPGPAVTLDGQPCKTITFWAQGSMYGKTEVAIGAQDNLVHRIRYGSEPLLEQTRKMMQSPQMKAQMAQAAKGVSMEKLQQMMPTSSQTTEAYSHILVGQPIAPAVFAAAAPKGMKETNLMGRRAAASPLVSLGKPAPDIAVTGMDGAQKRLSDFRGKVVLIDFWATWCPPCRKSLPETQRFHTEYGGKGLAVLAVSNEQKPTVTSFLAQNKYTFPAYLDRGSVAERAYHVTGIPSVAVIDRSGRLSAFIVGLSSRETILAALQKAGLQTN